MTRLILFIVTILFLCACEDESTSRQHTYPAVVTPMKKPSLNYPVYMNTDTLQFISFEGDADYWSCTFLNARKDTVTMVTDSMIADDLKDKLFEVRWFMDTLYEAGDNDRMYTAKRMSQFRLVNGEPFAAPIVEERILPATENTLLQTED